MKFSIRDLFLVTLIVALGLGWWREHLEAVRARREVLATERLYGEVRDRAVAEAEKLRAAWKMRSKYYDEKLAELPNSSAPAPNPRKK